MRDDENLLPSENLKKWKKKKIYVRDDEGKNSSRGKEEKSRTRTNENLKKKEVIIWRWDELIAKKKTKRSEKSSLIFKGKPGMYELSNWSPLLRTTQSPTWNSWCELLGTLELKVCYFSLAKLFYNDFKGILKL